MDTGLEHLKSQTIEISAADRNRGKRAHILGYYVEPDHPALTGLCQPTVEPRHEASRSMVERLVREGYQITWEQVKKYAHTLCRRCRRD
ncbi:MULTISPECIES: hypothetical protein [Paenibacillus]|uniref:Uncharacterized protein n=1 Tax=Paenibacillus naphthalenovorans TaxID=162209 RepID=A0A0U2INN2_9BACL|nr:MULTISPECIES: hypothetical protein [Paenibacillus]ALS24971.1 hypothetical protein IJ22_47090 [Paenibacillus naphthalenovorans]GCL74099.1 hypothetical protein PN4B1_40410 [Paenibacillus naphthalenovorans]SDJ34545.1 hypothetical protein SAMN05421868_12435 [Paenibacillus naphthalenovorans]